jgi:small-conductance mechanosensitive channel
MNGKNLFKFFVSRGAIIYTAISTALIVIALFTAEDSSVKILMPKRFLFLLLFSFVLALGSTIMKLESLSATTRRLLHAISFIGGFALFLVLCEVEFAPLMIATLIFAIVYVALTLITTRKKTASVSEKPISDAKQPKKNKKKTAEYTPMFKSNSSTQNGDKQ